MCIKNAGRDFISVIIDPCTCFPNSNNTKSKQQVAALNPKRGNSYVYKKILLSGKTQNRIKFLSELLYNHGFGLFHDKSKPP